MTLTFAAILAAADINPTDALVIRPAYVREHDDGIPGVHGDSSNAEILAYTRVQPASTRIFPVIPPVTWVVLRPGGGDRARLWSVLVNRGEISNDGVQREFDLELADRMADLRDRLVIGWRAPTNVAA